MSVVDSSAVDHVRRDIEDGAYHCPQCDTPFTRRSNLRRHFQIHIGSATLKAEDHPPSSTSANAEDSVPVQEKYPFNNPESMDPSRTESSTTPDYANGQLRPAHPKGNNRQTLLFAKAQNEGPTREIESIDLGAGRMGPSARPGHGSHTPTGMFTNAQVKISGGTFLNVAHIYECDSPAQGGGPAFPIAVLGLQALSFATRSHNPHCNHPFDPPPLLMRSEPTSMATAALRFPFLSQEMRTFIGPLTLWLFIKMLIKRRASMHQ